MQDVNEAGLSLGWKVVITRPRMEARAHEHLGRLGFAVFLPRLQISRPGAQGMVNRVDVMFPRYLFVQLDEQSIERAGLIRSTRGAVGLLRFGNRVAAVADPVIDSLKALTDDAGLITKPTGTFRSGQSVRVMSGVFAGLEAVFTQEDGPSRSAILVHFLGQQNQVIVPTRDLRAVA